MRNRQFVFAPKIQYKLAAERSEAGSQNLQFPHWCPRKELATSLNTAVAVFNSQPAARYSAGSRNIAARFDSFTHSHKWLCVETPI